MDKMDQKALAIVRYWIRRNSGPDLPDYEEFIVWKGKILQNYKYMIGTNLDQRYYEVTYNGNMQEWYLDVYEKSKNVKYMNITVEAEIMKKAAL